jgi:hypothetical protein
MFLGFWSEPESAGINNNDRARQLVGDFDWDIQPEDGFPSIAFDDTNKDSEIIFKNNFRGTLADRKFADVKLYQNDSQTSYATSPSSTWLAVCCISNMAKLEK